MSIPAMAADVIIVGAGLAGLTCAVDCHRDGLGVVVLEPADAVGGRVRTDLVEGFRLDRGFQVLLTAYPEVHRMLDVDALSLRRFEPGTLIWRGGRFHRVSDPFRRPSLLLATVRAPVGSLADKARIGVMRRRLLAAEPADLLRAPETTTAERLAAAGFSPAIIERLFRPWFAGVMCDPELRTSSRMFDVLFGMFAAGDAAVPAAGMQAIGDQLAGHLPSDAVRLNTEVLDVRPDAVVLAGGTELRAGAVVVATDGLTAARLTGVERPGSRGTTTVWFAADEAPIDEPMLLLDGEGGGPAQSAAVMSAVAPEYAPPGAALIAASVAGTVRAAGDDRDGLEVDVRSQLGSWFGPAVRRWQHLRTDRIAHALPEQLVPTSPRRSIRLSDGIYVCGDHRDTASIQGAMFSGRRTARRIGQDTQPIGA